MTSEKNLKLESNNVKINKRKDILDLTLEYIDAISTNVSTIDIVTLPGTSFIYENQPAKMAVLEPNIKFTIRCYENDSNIYFENLLNIRNLLPDFTIKKVSCDTCVYTFSNNVTLIYIRDDFKVNNTDDIIWFDACGGWSKKSLTTFFDEVNSSSKENRLIFTTVSTQIRNYELTHDFIKENRHLDTTSNIFNELFINEIKGKKTKILEYNYNGSSNEHNEGYSNCPMKCIGFHTVKESNLKVRIFNENE